MHVHTLKCDGPDCTVVVDLDLDPDENIIGWYDLNTISAEPKQDPVARMMGQSPRLTRPGNFMRGMFHSDVCLLNYVTAAVEAITKGDQPTIPATVARKFADHDEPVAEADDRGYA